MLVLKRSEKRNTRGWTHAVHGHFPRARQLKFRLLGFSATRCHRRFVLADSTCKTSKEMPPAGIVYAEFSGSNRAGNAAFSMKAFSATTQPIFIHLLRSESCLRLQRHRSRRPCFRPVLRDRTFFNTAEALRRQVSPAHLPFFRSWRFGFSRQLLAVCTSFALQLHLFLVFCLRTRVCA